VGVWLLEHMDMLISMGGFLVAIVGSGLSLWLRSYLEPVKVDVEALKEAAGELRRQNEDLERFRIGLRLPDCAAYWERCENAVAALETKLRLETNNLRSVVELEFTRQITQVAEENRRFREELGRQLQNDARDITRTQVTEDGMLIAIHNAIQTLRDRELTELFNRMLQLERGSRHHES